MFIASILLTVIKVLANLAGQLHLYRKYLRLRVRRPAARRTNWTVDV